MSHGGEKAAGQKNKVLKITMNETGDDKPDDTY